jgi:hypothetical protein
LGLCAGGDRGGTLGGGDLIDLTGGGVGGLSLAILMISWMMWKDVHREYFKGNARTWRGL